MNPRGKNFRLSKRKATICTGLLVSTHPPTTLSATNTPTSAAAAAQIGSELIAVAVQTHRTQPTTEKGRTSNYPIKSLHVIRQHRPPGWGGGSPPSDKGDDLGQALSFFLEEQRSDQAGMHAHAVAPEFCAVTRKARARRQSRQRPRRRCSRPPPGASPRPSSLASRPTRFSSGWRTRSSSARGRERSRRRSTPG